MWSHSLSGVSYQYVSLNILLYHKKVLTWLLCHLDYITTGDATDKRCPQCRGPLKTEKVVPVELFLQIHAPDQYQEVMDDLSAAKEKEEEEKAKNPNKVFHSSAKIDKMLEILHETRRETKNKDKTIIFSQFTSMVSLSCFLSMVLLSKSFSPSWISSNDHFVNMSSSMYALMVLCL